MRRGDRLLSPVASCQPAATSDNTDEVVTSAALGERVQKSGSAAPGLAGCDAAPEAARTRPRRRHPD